MIVCATFSDLLRLTSFQEFIIPTIVDECFTVMSYSFTKDRDNQECTCSKNNYDIHAGTVN